MFSRTTHLRVIFEYSQSMKIALAATETLSTLCMLIFSILDVDPGLISAIPAGPSLKQHDVLNISTYFMSIA